MYTAKITTDQNIEDLDTVFKAEQKQFPNNRASYTTTHSQNTFTVQCEATDPSALRAVLNSATTILQIYDTAKRLTEH